MTIRAWLGTLLWVFSGIMLGSPTVMAQAEPVADSVQASSVQDSSAQKSSLREVSPGEILPNGSPPDGASDLRFIFDVSGSMRHNDPEKLSVSSLELLAALLPTGVHAGIWTFGERIDNPLPLSRIDEQWRNKARALEPALSQYQQFTDIEGAVREASSVPGPGQRHIILLTDGMIDLFAPGGDKTQRDQRSRQALLGELAPSLSDQSVIVHAIAFSDQADQDLVDQLAQTTGGLAAKAQNPDDLLGVFLRIIDQLFPADQVPLKDGRFTIDDQVETFSALLFHAPDTKPAVLVAPDRSRYSRDDHPGNIRWQEESRFDLISVMSPQAGEWQLEGEVEAASRIQVESSLTLHTSELANTLYLGFPLTLSAWFEKDAMPKDMQASGMKMRVMLQDADGNMQVSSPLTEDGRKFSGTLPAPSRPGSARLIVDAKGEGLHRQRVLAVNVRSPIGAALNSAQQRVELAAQYPRLDNANTRIQASLQGKKLAVTGQGEGKWQVKLPELDPNYRLPLKLLAVITLDGETREIPLPDVPLNTHGQVGLDAAGLDQKGLGTQSLAQERDPPAAESQGLVRRAGQLWSETIAPPVERLSQHLGLNSQVLRPWMLALVLVVLILLLITMTLRPGQGRRRSPRREEPHV